MTAFGTIPQPGSLARQRIEDAGRAFQEQRARPCPHSLPCVRTLNPVKLLAEVREEIRKSEQIAEWEDMAESGKEYTASSFEELLEFVSWKTGIPISLIKSNIRATKLVLARHEVMYRARVELNLSLNQIGRLVGGRDHTTVLHGINTHAKRNGLEIT